jgi:UDP-N-acetylglucosamine 4,6-dehydratase
MNWSDKSVLITGGTGTFGNACVDEMLADAAYTPRRLIVYSRDESKQHTMAQRIGQSPPLRFFIGDVRDRDRLRRALDGVDIVIHAAALKQVPACEYNPIEAVKTNVGGAQNLIEAAIDAGVAKVVALCTDKNVAPANLYGATKLVAEKLFVQANCLSTRSGTKFAATRYGNVIGSRGSVVEVFRRQRATGSLTVTDPAMTRFLLTVRMGVRFVLNCVDTMRGGEVFVPKLPSATVAEVAEAVAPECAFTIVGVRPGEKMHETLVSADESRYVLDCGTHYVIQPPFHFWAADTAAAGVGGSVGVSVPLGFSYRSDTNTWGLTKAELEDMVREEHLL